MNPEAQRVRDIFVAAVKLPPGQWEAFLKGACASDDELRGQVSDLLREHQQAGDFLDRPAIPLRATGDFDAAANGAVRGSPDPGPAAPESPGAIIGPYKLLELIGEGGMGAVWMAEQREPMQRKVALKIIKAGMDTRQVVARFEAERQALALMDHPNIAKVLDGGATAGGRPYFVMELVKGVPITRYCDEHRLTPRERLGLFLPVCQAIQHAHQKGVVHRDVKPANVLVAPYDGRPVPKVIDFGVAKATGQRLTERTLFTGFGAVVGTLEYMSPEQAELNNQDIDTRSDVYALGVLLYELLTGTTPLSRERLKQAAFTEVLRLIREEEPPRPSTRLSESKETLPAISAQRHMEPARLTKVVRGELDWIVIKALEKDRSRRYETANGLARDVERYLADEPVQACPPSVAYRFRKFARRNKTGLAVVGLVLFFLILLGGGSGWVLRDREARRQETAQQARESVARARKWIGEDKLALAHEELAAAKGRIGADRAALGGLAAEVEALEANLGPYERFLNLAEKAHEAEFPQAVASILLDDPAGGTAVAPPQASSPEREPAQAVPFLLQALSCYGVLEQDDWSDRLERGRLEPEQAARVRRTAYEELLWLADDVAHREVDHRSGRKLSPQEGAQEGLAYLRQAEAAARPTSAFYQIRARFLRAQGEEREARQDEDLARQTPATIALDHYLLARAAYDAREKAEAVKQYEAALRVEPTHYWSLLNLGICLNNLGQQEQDFTLAAAAFTGCILKRPDHAPPYSGRGYAYLKLQRPRDAAAEFREALRLRPDYPEAHQGLGCALYAQGKHDEAAAELLRPDFPEAYKAHNALGKALKEQGKDAEAEAEFREALRLRPDFSEANVNLGITLGKEGKHAEEELEYRQALRLQPRDPVANNYLGISLLRQGKPDEAVAQWRQALRLQPDSFAARLNLGNVLNGQGKHAEAEVELREALRLRPDLPGAHSVHINLADALRDQGKHVEAEAEYREALRLQPGCTRAINSINDLGMAMYRQGKNAAAARFYTDSFAAEPKLADDLGTGRRYNAACAAALAGCGQGQDAANLDEEERARLRRQGLDWLRADLVAWGQLVEEQPDQARIRGQQTLRYWQQDADFAGVRGDALAKLPEADRQAWQQLWADVEQTLRRVNDNDTKDAKTKPPN